MSNPSSLKGFIKSASSRYLLTTLLPGANEVLTQSGTFKPNSTAFFATSPAIISTTGFDVFVQLVIAAIQTEPCPKLLLLCIAVFSEVLSSF